MSWPVPACASAAAVNLSFSPCLGDVVDVNLDVILRAPLVADFGEGVVGAGDPMVPAAERQFPGRVTVLDVGRCNDSDGAECRGLEDGTACGA